MKRKTSSTPSRIWTFGCFAPVTGADLVERQFIKAHRYYNTLIEIEKEAQDAVREVQHNHPVMAPLQARKQTILESLKQSRDAIKKARSAKRSNKVDVADLRAKVAQHKNELITIKAKIAEVRLAVNAEMKASYDAIREHAKSRVKIARKGSELYWGTYILVEKAVESAIAACKREHRPLKFKPYGRSARIGVQFQKSVTQAGRAQINGAPVADLFAHVDARMRLTPATGEMRAIKSKAGTPVNVRDKKGQLLLRIGSEGREPVWATFPVILQRPFPDDAIAKSAWIKREKIGTKWRYSFQIVLESRTFEATKKKGTRTAALDVGWRKKEEGGLRIFVLRDDAGQLTEYKLPSEFQTRYEKCNAIRSQRDDNFNKARDGLVYWLKNADVNEPDWLKERTQHIASWRACAKLAAVVLHWRGNRFSGDEVMFPTLEAWRKQDKHLLEWEVNLRDKVIARRTDYYRRIAIDLTTKYDRLVLEKFDLREVSKKRAPEQEKPDSPIAARRQRFEVAISELRNALESAAQKTGCTIIKIDPANTTRMCHVCKVIDTWDAASEIEHTCSNGHAWDQDANAAINLIERFDASDHAAE